MKILMSIYRFVAAALCVLIGLTAGMLAIDRLILIPRTARSLAPGAGYVHVHTTVVVGGRQIPDSWLPYVGWVSAGFALISFAWAAALLLSKSEPPNIGS